ncbi:MAG: hypothetical protein V4439_02965 [Patescibacteria group bacterium]
MRQSVKKFWIILFLIFSFFPVYKINASTNAGFIPSNIWYSKDPFEEGDKIKIYTLVFNPDTRELSGTVSFFDNTIFLGKKNFIVQSKGVKDISIDWTVTVGSHQIFAKIENAKFLISTGKYEDVYLSENETEKSESTVAKKIIPQSNTLGAGADLAGSNGIVDNVVSKTFQNIENSITSKTPDVIKNSVNSAVGFMEGVRQNVDVASENKQQEVKAEIASLDKQESTKMPSDIKIGNNKLLKPLKYAELFFLNLGSIIFGNKPLFYGISSIIIFFILRYALRLVF